MLSIEDSEFKIKFNGQQQQIDAQVLISSLIHTTTIIQELNKHFNTSKKIDIKVNALEKGSFLVHLELIETSIDALKNLLTKENITFASSLISGLVGLIAIKKHLKGKKANKIKTENGTTVIINGDNNRLTVDNQIYKIYESDTIINDALTSNFDVLENDSAIDSFEITDKNGKPYISVNRDDFKDLNVKSEIINDQSINTIEIANLNIVRLSFEKNLKWDFYYNGNKISARIIDPNFFELINKGETFSKGDILEVELQVNKVFDESVNTFINKSYQVNSIIKHTKRAEQNKINFDNIDSNT